MCTASATTSSRQPQAEFFAALGYDFYALDLRKYGRSLLPHQTPNFCRDLAEYYAELDAALEVIRHRDGHDTVIVTGHSAGGLIVSLWAAARLAEGVRVADAFVFNSPWLDLQGPFYMRTAGTEAINRLAQRRPYAVVPRTVTGVYAETLHRDLRGEWEYDWTWKPRDSFPVRAGWLRAMRMGHRTVHRGIDVGAPVMTLCSARSLVCQVWSEEASCADTVLDVKQIAKWSHQLGARRHSGEGRRCHPRRLLLAQGGTRPSLRPGRAVAGVRARLTPRVPVAPLT